MILKYIISTDEFIFIDIFQLNTIVMYQNYIYYILILNLFNINSIILISSSFHIKKCLFTNTTEDTFKCHQKFKMK